MKLKYAVKIVLYKLGLYDLEKEIRKIKKKRKQRDLNNPERLSVIEYCVGKGIDVGCGNNKTTENCIGVDILAKGEKGIHGSVKDKESEADICTSGNNLNMFKDGELDFVIARHNLEHYVDIFKTLYEWQRVLKEGGIMAIVLPDETRINTIELDVTHKHAFTPESFRKYIELMGGFEIIKLESVLKDWSFLCVCKKYRNKSEVTNDL